MLKLSLVICHFPVTVSAVLELMPIITRTGANNGKTCSNTIRPVVGLGTGGRPHHWMEHTRIDADLSASNRCELCF